MSSSILIQAVYIAILFISAYISDVFCCDVHILKLFYQACDNYPNTHRLGTPIQTNLCITASISKLRCSKYKCYARWFMLAVQKQDRNFLRTLQIGFLDVC